MYIQKKIAQTVWVGSDGDDDDDDEEDDGGGGGGGYSHDTDTCAGTAVGRGGTGSAGMATAVIRAIST